MVKKNDKEGACDITGKEIIAPQYESIIFSGGVFKYKGSDGNWHELGWTLDANGNGVRKATAPTSNTSPAVASSSSSSSTTASTRPTHSSSSSSGNGRLLYKGTYTSNGTVYTGNQSMNVMSGTYEVEIYENAMTLNGLYCELKEVMSNGTRRYDWSNMNSYLVSPSYEIRKIYPSQFFGVPDGVEYFQKGQVATPAPTQQMGQYPQQTYSQQPSQPQPSPSYTPQPAQQKDCTICHGSGKCNTCNGKGYYTNLGLGSGTHPCPNCPNHSGRCQWCNGTGKQN